MPPPLPPLHSLLGGKGPRLLETRRRARSWPWARDKLRVPNPIFLGEESIRFKSHRRPCRERRGAERRGGGPRRPARRRQSRGTHPQAPCCHPLPRGQQAAGTRGRGAGKGSLPPRRGRALWPQHRVGAPAAPSPGPRPPSPAASEPPLAPPRAARGKFLQLRGGGGGRPGPRSWPAPRGQAPGRRRPDSRPGPPAPGPLCAQRRRRGAPAGLAPAPGTKGRAAGGVGPARRTGRAGPSRGRGGDPGRPRSPAVEPVLAGVALDHEAGNVVGQPADAVHRHRRHVRAARPPAARAALRVGPGGPGRAGAGRAGAGAGDGPGEHDSPRVPAARPHKAGRAQAREPPAGPGRRARVCAGPACGTQKGMDARGRRAAGGEPRPHRRDPRPPSGLYVSAPGGAASACGLAAAPAAGRRAADLPGEGGPETPMGDRWAGHPCEGEKKVGWEPCLGSRGAWELSGEKVSGGRGGGRRETPCRRRWARVLGGDMGRHLQGRGAGRHWVRVRGGLGIHPSEGRDPTACPFSLEGRGDTAWLQLCSDSEALLPQPLPFCSLFSCLPPHSWLRTPRPPFCCPWTSLMLSSKGGRSAGTGQLWKKSDYLNLSCANTGQSSQAWVT